MSQQHTLHWEADVILNDGDIATLRAIQPTDRPAVEAFFERVSDHSKYLRFFSTHPHLTEEDWQRWAHTRGYDKVTIVLEERGDIVAIAGYELVESFLPARVGDVSFLVQDSHHGKGVGNILLEHLAEIGREGKVERFFAEMLTQNRQMVQVFIRAGYSAAPELADGFISVDFTIAPNATSREVMERRELRAEANSIRRLLNPATVAIVGSPAVSQPDAAHFDTLEDLQGPADLVIAESGQDYRALMQAAAQAGAKGVVVMARSQNPGVTRTDARDIVLAARDYGLRALGPAALGLINTSRGLNATPAPMPRAGQVGLFTQSAGVATLTLSHAIERGCGLSNFLAAGSFADVTGNDVMQFWSDDPDTHICLLSLDTIGNPRKFFRVLRRLALDKPVVVFLPSRALQSARHYEQEGLIAASPAVLDDIIRNTGAMVVTRRDEMYDIAQLLARQPVPRGRRIRVISNSAGLSDQMVASAARFGLKASAVTVYDSPAAGIAQQAAQALADPDVDAVLCAVVEIGEFILKDAHSRLAALAAGPAVEHHTPLIASFVGFEFPEFRAAQGPEAPGQLPVFGTYADALSALATIIDNDKRRALARPAPHDEVASGDEAAATAVVADILADSPTGRWATDSECAAILSAYGIDIVPWQPVDGMEEAIEAAEEFGWDVVLKCTSPMVRGRSELPTVLRHIHSAVDMEQAWETLVQLTQDLHLGCDPAILEPAVQPTVAAGASLTARAIEDPVIGPMLSVGIAGLPSDLLGDVAWRVPPLRRTDVLDMLSELKAAPLLAGYQGAKAAHMHGIEDVLMRLARLCDDIASIVDIELTPIVAGLDATSVVGARMRIAPLDTQRDPLARRLGK
ncbi:GNAT family N-acetyltransferase [Corynebacterium lizhenjunii]|uniref:GNAT family N-acetyltransferase n=1 Tax=Corynebacterium lizhenjunii TaxID=2709394 RepID=A0A7T0PAG0_9CORY|nr:GNAT family N-acetyltransferase [Corynebacterium lizhenjunii]QPK79843.1 GNAT family N-acetyltransferase [Corynebacterium lizhenjunii]